MLSERLKQLRTAKHLTQLDAAKHLGIAKTTYASYEQGRREPDNKMLAKLANFFDVSLDYLLGNTEKPQHVDLADSKNETIMTFEGKPIPPQDLELIRRLLRGGNHDD